MLAGTNKRIERRTSREQPSLLKKKFRIWQPLLKLGPGGSPDEGMEIIMNGRM